MDAINSPPGDGKFPGLQQTQADADIVTPNTQALDKAEFEEQNVDPAWLKAFGISHAEDTTDAGPDSLRRLKKELKYSVNNPVECVSVSPIGQDLFHWQGVILGPGDTSYENGRFLVDIRIPGNYPVKPPVIKFTTPIFHPNINSRGEISLDLLGSGWCPALTIQNVLLSICSFLDSPEPNNPLLPEIAHLYQTDRLRYEATIQDWVKKFASGTS